MALIPSSFGSLLFSLFALTIRGQIEGPDIHPDDSTLNPWVSAPFLMFWFWQC